MFKRDNFKPEHRKLLINTIGENDTLFGKKRKFYQQKEKSKDKVKDVNNQLIMIESINKIINEK